MHDSENRVEYLLVDLDGFKMINELSVTSVDYDKRIEYLKNWIEWINAGDKYTWMFLKSKYYKTFYYDRLKIVKKYYSGRLYSGLDFDL